MIYIHFLTCFNLSEKFIIYLHLGHWHQVG
jgi:hypothetical protein